MRPGQSVADFCVVLEALGRKAYPECTIEDRSMDYAQIVLENLKHWPEQVQILSALHDVDPRYVYEKVKELAISIEQANLINSRRASSHVVVPQRSWKVRAREYEQGERFAEQLRNHRRNENTRNTIAPGRAPSQRETQFQGPRERQEVPTNNEESQLLNDMTQALLDSGSMISIIPLQVLANAYYKGFDVETLKREDDSQMETIYDASNNPMKFLGIVRIQVKLQGGNPSEIAFHISNERSNEILLGTNALSKLGVQMVISRHAGKGEVETRESASARSVLAADRVVIPALCVRSVTAVCEVPEGTMEGIIWATKEGINSGVYKVQSKEITVPIRNRDHHPMVIQKGEKLGEWGTEKWSTKWEDCTMLEQGNVSMSIEEKRNLLKEQIQQNRKESYIDKDLTNFLTNYADVFAVCERELNQTDLVKMSIDTGNSQPIKLRTRPVPLGLRGRLREMLQDLENRKIIEKSNSDWAFPIVLVEKKDGGIRLCVDY
ncbi:hypothetical protein OSTOST_24943, partial [Ostertagia ostertagi]